MDIAYAHEPDLAAEAFIAVLHASGLAERRPVEDEPRIRRMLAQADLVVTARIGGRLVGVSRALTDFAFCCYLSDLAVDRDFQGRSIGRQLIKETRRLAGPDAMCLLLSAPAAMDFYRRIGMPWADNAFLYPRGQ